MADTPDDTYRPNKLDQVLDLWRAGHEGGMWDEALERLGPASEGSMIRKLFDRLQALDESLRA